jgi:hypothetical protein
MILVYEYRVVFPIPKRELIHDAVFRPQQDEQAA